MSKLTFLFGLLVALSVFASGEAGHDDHQAIPGQMIILQVLNFLLFVGVLVFFLRPKVIAFFRMRAESFVAAKKRADELKKNAAENKKIMEEKLRDLENSRQATISNARNEAERLRQQIVREAEEMVVKIKDEAERSVQNEMQRARQELRTTLLTEAIDAAKKQVAKNLSDLDQRRLQGEFVEKIQAVKQ